VLEPSASECHKQMSEANPFHCALEAQAKIGNRAVQTACMYVSRERVMEMKQGTDQGGRHEYVSLILLILGYNRYKDNRISTIIKEEAHRLVLWAVHGPPVRHDMPSTSSRSAHALKWEKWVCMHECNQKDCLKPHHLLWGTASENKLDLTFKYRELRRVQQGRKDYQPVFPEEVQEKNEYLRRQELKKIEDAIKREKRGADEAKIAQRKKVLRNRVVKISE
ncbi:hypothetical protein CEUSTIGMA_g4506.t1, partial [Chlamydomonas eustigma]